MGLLKPTPGEVHDRLSILALKIRVAQDKQKECRHFLEEREELKQYLSLHYPDKDQPNFQKLAAAIAAVNGTLWTLEDDRRALISTGGEAQRLAENARQTTLLNDERAHLIREVNRVYGITAEEKLY